MRAMSWRTWRSRPVFSSWPVACWKRRLNSSSRDSLRRCSNSCSASSIMSLAFKAGRTAALKAKDIIELAEHELEQRLKESREELFNLRFQHATGQLENTGRLRQVRQDIARILSVQNSQKSKES